MGRSWRIKLKTFQLKNDLLDLTLVPEFGCHWTSLKYHARGTWLNLLYPVPKISQLPQFSTRDGSYILAPWSNRLQNAHFKFEEKDYHLRPNFPDGTTIHGDVWTRPWKIVRKALDYFEAELQTHHFSDFNYPFPLIFRHSISLIGSQLAVSLYIENNHNDNVPVGMGFHPFWNRRLVKGGTDVVLKVPARKIYPTKVAIPQGPAEPVTEKTDLRRGKDLSGVDLDDCFTDLSAQEIDLTWGNPGVQVRYQFSSIFGHVVIYSPLDEKGTPKDFVAVEPVTNVTDGFNLLTKGWSNTGVKILAPKESWGGTWTLKVSTLL